MVGATRESDIAQVECILTRTAKRELWKLRAFKGRKEEEKSVRSSVVVGEPLRAQSHGQGSVPNRVRKPAGRMSHAGQVAGASSNVVPRALGTQAQGSTGVRPCILLSAS